MAMNGATLIKMMPAIARSDSPVEEVILDNQGEPTMAMSVETVSIMAPPMELTANPTVGETIESDTRKEPEMVENDVQLWTPETAHTGRSVDEEEEELNEEIYHRSGPPCDTEDEVENNEIEQEAGDGESP
jgi:hypothetical protein